MKIAKGISANTATIILFVNMGPINPEKMQFMHR
jgi:hypothetical protein